MSNPPNTLVEFDGEQYLKQPQFQLSINGHRSFLCQTKEECEVAFINAIKEFPNVTVQIIKVHAKQVGDGFAYDSAIRIVMKTTYNGG